MRPVRTQEPTHFYLSSVTASLTVAEVTCLRDAMLQANGARRSYAEHVRPGVLTAVQHDRSHPLNGSMCVPKPACNGHSPRTRSMDGLSMLPRVLLLVSGRPSLILGSPAFRLSVPHQAARISLSFESKLTHAGIVLSVIQVWLNNWPLRGDAGWPLELQYSSMGPWLDNEPLCSTGSIARQGQHHEPSGDSGQRCPVCMQIPITRIWMMSLGVRQSEVTSNDAPW